MFPSGRTPLASLSTRPCLDDMVKGLDLRLKLKLQPLNQKLAPIKAVAMDTTTNELTQNLKR